ncbi:MAG: hypothetical protein HY520_03425 [Candidatus Aenigmarchaeota archaeon]|nr:hypothetical protein [Candidatus Aenigmarchaeota archaeon]
MERIGRIAFYAGLIVSVAAGFVNVGPMAVTGLMVLGIIVGLLNVTGSEVQRFLTGTVALLLAGFVLSATDALGATATTVLAHFVAFVAGAALLVALREVYAVTKAK